MEPCSATGRYGKAGTGTGGEDIIMRIITALAGLTALTLAACGQGGAGGDDSGNAPDATEPAAAGPAPGRMDGPKPGLWRVTTAVTGMPAGVTLPSIETCIRRQDFSEMQRGPTGRMPDDVDCSEQTFRREGDAMVGRSVCTMSDGARTESDIRITGDFERRYTMEVTNRTTPAPSPGMATNSMTMTAERIGDCPAESAAQ